MIKLSVLIPVWNQEELVINALEHLPRRDDIEVLVIDDGSTDNTLANLRKYKEDHPELNLTVVANKGNKPAPLLRKTCRLYKCKFAGSSIFKQNSYK